MWEGHVLGSVEAAMGWGLEAEGGPPASMKVELAQEGLPWAQQRAHTGACRWLGRAEALQE